VTSEKVRPDEGGPSRRQRLIVLTSRWGDGNDEVAFVVRSIAGAASRTFDVDVLTPGPIGTSRPDGAFDLLAIGEPAPGSAWPDPARTVWPEAVRAGMDQPPLVLLDCPESTVVELLEQAAPHFPVLAPASTSAVPAGLDGVLVVSAVDASTADDDSASATSEAAIGLHVPVNPLASRRPHNGFGFTDYILVLTDRDTEVADDAGPTPAVAWLSARFPRRHVVAIENATAAAWMARSLRGRVAVDTRTDLWRLMAFAMVVVDLRPGPLMARECVEALRFGTPIVVPSWSTAAALAAGGGGFQYDTVAELLQAVEAVSDDRVRETARTKGKRLADDLYGDPDRFIQRVGVALEAAAQQSSRGGKASSGPWLNKLKLGL